ncbi:MAG: hypothetical protein AAFQ36_09440 [Pseudomonadota bacterium]
MADTFATQRPMLDSPARHVAAVTPHDTNNLSNVPRALYIGGAGDVKVDAAGSGTVTFAGVYGWLPVRALKVYDTGTTATNIVAVW